MADVRLPNKVKLYGYLSCSPHCLKQSSAAIVPLSSEHNYVGEVVVTRNHITESTELRLQLGLLKQSRCDWSRTDKTYYGD